MAFSRSRFASMTMAGALLLAACGSDAVEEAAKDTVAEDATTTTAAPEVTETSVEETTTTTVAETTTTVEETTTTAAPVISGPADGVLYTEAESRYSLLTSPDWGAESDEFPNGIVGWFTGSDSADFRENINILTDDVPSSTPLDAILDSSITQIEASFEGFVLIADNVVSRPGQPDLGVLEYSAVQNGLEIRFIQVFGVWNDTLVVVTGSTDARNGNEGVERLRPYLLTLNPPA